MAVQFFGQYLLEKGIITAEQLLKVIEYQELQNLRIGDLAVRQGLLSENDAARVNQLQLSQDIRFGEAAIQLGVLEEVEVQILLTSQRNSHVYFGEAVALLRLAPRDEIRKALEEFTTEQATYERAAFDIPESVRLAPVVASYFDLSLKLLLRYWGVAAKPGEVITGLRELCLEGNAVEVRFSGDLAVRCFLAAPAGVAVKGGKNLLEAAEITPEDCIDLTKELANLVCGNLIARLSQEGQNATISPPEVVSSPVVLADEQAVRLEAATPYGSYTVAVAF